MPRFSSRDEFVSYLATAQWEDKEDFIASLCSAKDVADLGCLDHTALEALSLGEKWLHARIRAVAKSCVGVDIAADEVAKLKEAGIGDIVIQDVEKLNLGRKFEVIVAGDIIEHLSNPGLFLDRVKAHMNKDSEFVFSTPNPFSIEQMIGAIADHRIAVHPQHTCWICPRVAWELLRRHGFEIIDLVWARTRFPAYYYNSSEELLKSLSETLKVSHPHTRTDYLIRARLATDD